MLQVFDPLEYVKSEILSFNQAVELADISPRTMENRIEAGKAPPFFEIHGKRFTVRSALNAWMAKDGHKRPKRG